MQHSPHRRIHWLMVSDGPCMGLTTSQLGSTSRQQTVQQSPHRWLQQYMGGVGVVGAQWREIEKIRVSGARHVTVWLSYLLISVSQAAACAAKSPQMLKGPWWRLGIVLLQLPLALCVGFWLSSSVWGAALMWL